MPRRSPKIQEPLPESKEMLAGGMDQRGRWGPADSGNRRRKAASGPGALLLEGTGKKIEL